MTLVQALTNLRAATDALSKHPTKANALYAKQCLARVEELLNGT